MDEKFPDRIDSKFRYVLLAAGRAEQMMRGARPKVESGSAKPTRVAMLEITHDLVDWGYGPTPTLGPDIFGDVGEADEMEAEAAAETETAEDDDEEEAVH